MILKRELFSTQFERTITLHVHVPEEKKDEPLPCLYMFDGQNLFNDEDATYGYSWRLENHLEESPQEMIIVGLECSHHGNDRLSEYSPFSFYDEEFHEGFEGRGTQTMEFLVDEVIPFVEQEFHAIPERDSRFIGGSSCGALMSLYGLYKYSSLFSKAIALSPYIVPVQSELVYDMWESEIELPSALFVSWGTNEGENAHEFILETKAISEINNQLVRKGVRILMDVKIGGTHSEYQWEQEADAFFTFLKNEEI